VHLVESGDLASGAIWGTLRGVELVRRPDAGASVLAGQEARPA
jgi:hypothetical protein